MTCSAVGVLSCQLSPLKRATVASGDTHNMGGTHNIVLSQLSTPKYVTLATVIQRGKSRFLGKVFRPKISVLGENGVEI